MKIKFILLALLWGVFSFSPLVHAVIVGKVIDSETKQEIPKLVSTDGDLYINSLKIRNSVENLKKHTVIVMRQEVDGSQARGAGIAIDKRHILTVNHIVTETGRYFYNENKNAQPYWATVIKQNPEHDLALLEIDKGAPDLIAEPMVFAAQLNIKETVYTIGHPNTALYSLTKGYIDKFNQMAYKGVEGVLLHIKITGGNSGGFVINNKGDLVGMIFSGSQVITRGYMISKDDIQRFLAAD